MNNIFLKSSIQLEGLSRTFSYCLPKNVSKYKLAIFLHGAGENSSTFLSSTTATYRFADSLVDNGFIVVAPDARSDFGTAPFLPRWESENDNNPDVALIIHIATTMVNEFNNNNTTKIDKDHIFIIGGSSGGLLASRMGLLNGSENVLRGIVSVNSSDANVVALKNGNLVFSLDQMDINSRHVHTLLVNSSIDNIFPIESKIEHYAHLYNAIGHGVKFLWDNTPEGSHNWGMWTEELHPAIIDWMLHS